MEPTTTAVQPVSTTDPSHEKTAVNSERLDTASESPNNNNNTSASSSPKNDGVASGLLKMLDDESILDGLEDIPPSENLLDDPEIYKDTDLNGVHKIGTSMDYAKDLDERRRIHPSDDGSFVHSYSDLSETDEFSPLQFNTARQFELEFKLHESEQRIEQLTLQLKGKSMQLEQVQVALISYEEEIMQLRNHSSEDRPIPKKASSNGLPQTPVGAVSLETAEQLSSKIIKLQQRVEELEDVMVSTKLDNAQLKETNDFLKSKLKRITKKPSEKKPSTNGSSVRNIFARN